jgi:hypothetical protein
MAIWTKTAVASETQEKTDESRLAECEQAFTAARLDFNSAYRSFCDFHKTHRTGPFFVRRGDLNFVEFPRETPEAKALAVDVEKKRQKFHTLMAERADLLKKR